MTGSTSIIVPAAVFVGVFAVLLAILALAGRRGAATHRRLDEHAVPVASHESRRLERVNVLKEQHYSSFRIVDAFLRRFKPGADRGRRADAGERLAHRFAIPARALPGRGDSRRRREDGDRRLRSSRFPSSPLG